MNEKEKGERKEEGEEEKAAAAPSSAPPPAASPPRLPLLPHPNRAAVASVSACFKGWSGGGPSAAAAAAAAWNSLSDDEARRLAVERWRSSVAEEAARDSAKARAEAKEKLLRLFKSAKGPLRIEHGTRWEEARAALERRAKRAAAAAATASKPSSSTTLAPAEEEEAEEAEDAALLFASVPASVALEAFEEHVRDLRRLWKEQKRAAEDARLRAERRNRDAFRDLLARRFSLGLPGAGAGAAAAAAARRRRRA